MSSPPGIPDHTLLRPVGRGAYGEVWLARNIMGAPRAVKIIWRRQFESDRPYEREFAGIQSYEPVSRKTDGLVQVLHVGRNDAEGYFYYVMELADGLGGEDNADQPSILSKPLSSLDAFHDYKPRTLRSELERRGSLPAAECLSLAIELAEGLACLHRHGLVHRDVKPGNIIYVNGRAKLADIGLVSTRNEGRTFVGTEGYIPPEGPGSSAADIYALGMVLYEALTGFPPVRFPRVPPAWLADGSGAEALEFHQVVLKAGEGRRDLRYPTAAALQADLALLQSGHSVRRVRALQRRANRSRRLAVVAIAAGLVAAGSVWLSHYRVHLETEQRKREHQWRREAEQAREVAERAKIAAEAAEHQARIQLLAALTDQARATVRSGELGQRVQTLDAVRKAATLTNNPTLRQTALSALVLPDLRLDREIAVPPDATLAALDPAFARLALGRGTNAVEIRSTADGALLATLPPHALQSAQSAVWNHDGRFVAINRAGQPPAWRAEVEVWALPDAHRVLSLPATRYGACAFHPRLPRLVAANPGDTVGIWNLETGREISQWPATGVVHHVQFSPDGGSVVVQHRIGKAWFTSLLDADRGSVRSVTPSGWVDAIAWHPRDKFVAFAARQGEIYLHDRHTGETSVLGRHKNEAQGAAFSPDGAYLFTGGGEQEIICWELATRQRVFEFTAQNPQMQFAGTNARCAFLARTGLRLHELVRPTASWELPVDLGSTVRQAAFSPDGRWLAVGGSAGLGVWDLHGRNPPAVIELREHATPFFSPDSSELFAFNIERLGRWRVEGRENSAPRLQELSAPATDRVHAGQFAGQSLVLAANSGLLVYPSADAERRELLGIYSVHASLSSDEKWLVATRGDGMSIYTFRPWALVKSLPVDSGIFDHAFAPGDGELAMVTASGVTFVDTRDWATQRRLPVALDRRARILFLPDGESFWLWHDARTAALYDRRTLTLQLPLASGVLPLAVSPNGEQLLVSLDSRRLQLWDWRALRRALQDLGLAWGR